MPLPKGVECGTKYVVEVPANGIPLPGVDAITRYLADLDVRVPGLYDAESLEHYAHYRQFNVRAGLDDAGFEWVWKTTRGTLPKRLDSTLRKLWDVRLPREAISQLGNIASEHTERISRHVLEFTQDFGWQRGAFGDDDSCFWTDRRGAKAMLHSMGAYALRFYDPDYDETGWARSWLVPTNDFYVLFNAYSKNNIGVCYDALSQSRILAYFLGCSYKRVDPLTNHGNADGTLWINGRKQNDYNCGRVPHGYVVGYPEDIAAVKSYDFECHDVDSEEYDERYTTCERCDDTVSNDDTSCVDEQSWCDYCTRHYASWCDHCDEYHCADDCRSVVVNDRGESETWCTSCYENDADQCDSCNEYFANASLVEVHGGYWVCTSCVENEVEECEVCGSLNTSMRNGSCHCAANRDQRLMRRVAALDFSREQAVAV